MSSLVNSFSIIHRQSAIMLDKQLKSMDISVGQFMAILCICETEGLSQEQVATRLRIDKGAVARTVRQLMEAGYVTRCVSREDRRQYQLFPTEKARAVHAGIVQITDSWEKSLTGGLTDIEADLLRNLLDKVVAQLV